MTPLASLHWSDLVLLLTGTMAAISCVRFFFPGLVAIPFRWSLVGLHKPWESFPLLEGVLAHNRSGEVYDNLMEDFLQETGIGILFFGEDLLLRGLNGAARRFLGTSRDIWAGESATDFLPKELAAIVVECGRDKLHASTGSKSVTLRGVTREQVSGHAILLHDKTGDFYGVALFLLRAAGARPSSAGAREQELPLNEEIDRMKQLASIGLHAAGMAHEIKNPLVALKTFSELLPSKYDDPEFREHFSKLALNQIRRIDSIVNDVLDYARPKPPEFELANPMEILQEALGILAMQISENKISVRELDAAKCPCLWVDGEQMRRVFLNVLLNAVEAMPKGGDLTIASVSHVQPGRSGMPSAGYLEITIVDSGHGISPKDLERVFEPFYSTKKKGSGLGLAISKRVVEDHGGSIEFKNGKKGTLCVITLPVLEEKGSGVQAAPEGRKTFTATRRALKDLVSQNES